jgi:hypothetical protein
MRSFVFCLVSLMVLGTSGSAFAECYGDAAGQYGCNSALQGASSSGSGELVRFGGESERVLPDNGSTTEEQRQMLKSIVTSNGSTHSQGAFTRSMQAGARPLRPFGNRAIIIRTR